MRPPPRRLGLPKRKLVRSRRAQIADTARMPVYIAVQSGRAERFIGGWIGARRLGAGSPRHDRRRPAPRTTAGDAVEPAELGPELESSSGGASERPSEAVAAAYTPAPEDET